MLLDPNNPYYQQKMAATQNSGQVGQMQTPDKLQFISGNMYPGSQQDRTQYATPTQMPAGAQAVAIQADYDAKINPITGEPMASYASGGIAALRYNGEENGSQVEASVEDTKPATMADLADQLKTAYRTNENYNDIWKKFAATQESDPKQWYRHQLDFLGNQVGWQQGQNTSERVAGIQPQIDATIADAKKSGLSDQEINSIMSGSAQEANMANQRRIINEQQSGGTFNGIGEAVPMFAGIAAMALAPELAPLLSSQLGTFGGALASGALTGGALGGIGAASTGRDIGQGIIKGGATGAIGGGITGGIAGLDPSIAQGIRGLNTARNIYNFTQNPTNIGAGINAARGAYNLGSTITAAHGGLMAGGGIANLGSYSDGGRLLKGPGDGMSDNIPATIGGKQPARLADSEFVLPADIVSHLGNGSTDAGAKVLYKMMDRIRMARTGTKKQGKQINPSKFLPE